jgi:ligand-binding sensor domain-containing protein
VDRIDRFDPRTESFAHYQIDLRHSSSTSVAVMHIDQDRHGQIWLSTGLGLFKLDPASGKVMQFRHNPGDAYSLSSNDVQSTTEDRSRRFWVANRTGVDEFDWKTGKVKRHIPLVEPVRNCLVYEDREGLLWLTYDSGGGAGFGYIRS